MFEEHYFEVKVDPAPLPPADVDVSIVGGPKANVPGCVERPCESCGAPTWVGPANQPLLARQNVTVWCLPCALVETVKRRKAGTSPEFFVRQETLAEVERELKRRAK